MGFWRAKAGASHAKKECAEAEGLISDPYNTYSNTDTSAEDANFDLACVPVYASHLDPVKLLGVAEGMFSYVDQFGITRFDTCPGTVADTIIRPTMQQMQSAQSAESSSFYQDSVPRRNKHESQGKFLERLFEFSDISLEPGPISIHDFPSHAPLQVRKNPTNIQTTSTPADIKRANDESSKENYPPANFNAN